MRFDYISMLLEGKDCSAILDGMAQTSFDELLEIDLPHDTCRDLYHIEGKYAMPAEHSSYSAAFVYARDHLVHPNDLLLHNALMNPQTLGDQLKNAPTPGILVNELRYRLRDGGWCWTHQVLIGGTQYGLPEGIVYLYLYDAREDMGESAASPDEDSSLRDGQTGLYYERVFLGRARELMVRLQGEWCVIVIHIEHFKLFCDWNGQEKGNELLRKFGETLRNTAQTCGGYAAYRGQDDFCILMPYDRPRIDALYDELRRIICEVGSTVGFGPLFGICKIENAGESILDVLNRAALTAEEIKGDFRTRIQLYNAALHEKNTQEFRMLTEFQQALESDEIIFFLQPQCRAANGRIVGAESLARWQKKNGEWVSPAVFVPVLEKFGLVTALDQRIWELVCVWLRKMLDQGMHLVPISVNISQIDFFTINVPDYLCGLVQKYNIPPSLIKVEVTESAYVEDTSVIRANIKTLRERGFLVLMDDFGSGYSSLNMLRNLNVDVIKLDAQFLHIKQEEERKGVSIVESVIDMAKTLGTPIIAEGVETRAQVNFLADLGCRYMQGFFYYKPMPAEAFEKLLVNENNMDYHGFIFKANQQLHAREFLNDNIYSDAMLNNVLGPVCFYNWQGDNVDIVRFNQQFYQMVDIEAEELNERRFHIQNFFYPGDFQKFVKMLEEASRDRINGAKGFFRVYKPSNAIVWVQIHVYFLSEDENGKRFYASCQDVTEMQYLSMDMPGAYYRCTVDDGYRFLYISANFLAMTGFTEEEILAEFDNRLIRMVHPEDVPLLEGDVDSMLTGEEDFPRPFRLRHKNGGYIYVVEKDRLSDHFGTLSFQCMAIEVTDTMRLRNQMQLLTRFLSSSIVFVHGRNQEQMRYEVLVHGLEKQLGLDREAFERSLNDGSFLSRLDTPAAQRDRGRYWEFREHPDEMNDICAYLRPDGERVRLHCKFDAVRDGESDVVCVIAFTYLENRLLENLR